MLGDERASLIALFCLIENGPHLPYGHLGVRGVLDRSHLAAFIQRPDGANEQCGRSVPGIGELAEENPAIQWTFDEGCPHLATCDRRDEGDFVSSCQSGFTTGEYLVHCDSRVRGQRVGSRKKRDRLQKIAHSGTWCHGQTGVSDSELVGV